MRPDAETWRALRILASEAARFGNRALADLYRAKIERVEADEAKQVQNDAFKRANDVLSGWVRGAMMQNRVRGYWRRAGRDVLSGRERLACFSADRSLCIAADQSNNRGVLYERDGDAWILACRFAPVRQEAGPDREPIRLRVWHDAPRAKRDRYLHDALEAIWSGAWSPGVVTIRFNRRKHTIDALVSYTKPLLPSRTEGATATLGPYNAETGALPLSVDAPGFKGRDYAHRIWRMLDMREQFDEIRARLQRRMGRGPKRRQVFRRKLAALGNYETWSDGVVHQWSAEIVRYCANAGVRTIRLHELGTGDLPWHRLAQQVRYKAQDAGMLVVTDADERSSGDAS